MSKGLSAASSPNRPFAAAVGTMASEVGKITAGVGIKELACTGFQIIFMLSNMEAFAHNPKIEFGIALSIPFIFEYAEMAIKQKKFKPSPKTRNLISLAATLAISMVILKYHGELLHEGGSLHHLYEDSWLEHVVENFAQVLRDLGHNVAHFFGIEPHEALHGGHDHHDHGHDHGGHRPH